MQQKLSVFEILIIEGTDETKKRIIYEVLKSYDLNNSLKKLLQKERGKRKSK